MPAANLICSAAITGLTPPKTAPLTPPLCSTGTFNLCGGKITGNKSRMPCNMRTPLESLYGGEISGNDTTYTDASPVLPLSWFPAPPEYERRHHQDNISNARRRCMRQGIPEPQQHANTPAADQRGNPCPASTNDDLGFDGGGGMWICMRLWTSSAPPASPVTTPVRSTIGERHLRQRLRRRRVRNEHLPACRRRDLRQLRRSGQL